MKTLKIYSLIALTALLTAMNASAAKDRGGGSIIESVFRLKSAEILNKIKNSEEANSFCSFQKIQIALDKTAVRVVDQLIDLETGKAIESELFDAWTQNNVIQLKRSSWDSLFNNYGFEKNGHALSALVLHELYRATGECNDDNFVISERVINILANTSPKGKTWKFIYKRMNSHYDAPQACNARYNPDKSLVCLSSLKYTNLVNVFNDNGDGNVETIFSYKASEEQAQQIRNMLGMVSEGVALYFVVDTQTAQAYYGVDLNNMIPLAAL